MAHKATIHNTRLLDILSIHRTKGLGTNCHLISNTIPNPSTWANELHIVCICILFLAILSCFFIWLFPFHFFYSPDYTRSLPQGLPFFWLSLADPTPEQQHKFAGWLKYLSGQDKSLPKCLKYKHEAHLLYLLLNYVCIFLDLELNLTWFRYLMPRENPTQVTTSIKCCYAPDPSCVLPQVWNYMAVYRH